MVMNIRKRSGELLSNDYISTPLKKFCIAICVTDDKTLNDFFTVVGIDSHHTKNYDSLFDSNNDKEIICEKDAIVPDINSDENQGDSRHSELQPVTLNDSNPSNELNPPVINKFIYILKLANDRYYVGKTNNVEKRYQEHLDGNGSLWTKTYKPLSIEKVLDLISDFDEDKYTKEYMAKYGIDKVRGGSYIEVSLSKIQIDMLQKEIWAAKNKCVRCGRGGHFINKCFAKKNIYGTDLP